MIPLSIVAAGVIAVATAIFTLSSDKPRTADQRGITLQTLIVTAVLVLMAVAAGVVITAITRGQQQNLEENAQVGSDSACEVWEIYDTNLAAAGRGGPSGTGGIESSARGCIRACYVEYTPTAAPPGTGDLTGVSITNQSSSSATIAILKFGRNQSILKPAASPWKTVYQVSGVRSLDSNSANNDTDTVDIVSFSSDGSSGSDKLDANEERYEIRVSGGGRTCQVYNVNDNKEAFRST